MAFAASSPSASRPPCPDVTPHDPLPPDSTKSRKNTIGAPPRHITSQATLRIVCGAPHTVREICSPGSVRGAARKGRPYRDDQVGGVAQESVHRVEQISRRLPHPIAVRSDANTCDLHSARLQLDHEEHHVADRSDHPQGLDAEKIALFVEGGGSGSSHAKAGARRGARSRSEEHT